jgi:hypothetical protein
MTLQQLPEPANLEQLKKASQVVTRRSPKPRAKRNSEVRSGLNRAIPQTSRDCLT